MLKIDNPSRIADFLIMRDAREMLFFKSPPVTPTTDYKVYIMRNTFQERNGAK